MSKIILLLGCSYDNALKRILWGGLMMLCAMVTDITVATGSVILIRALLPLFLWARFMEYLCWLGRGETCTFHFS